VRKKPYKRLKRSFYEKGKFYCILHFFSFLLQAQQSTTLDRKSKTAPDWLEPAIDDDFDSLNNINRFKDKYVFFDFSLDEDLNLSRLEANRDIVSQIAGHIRLITTNDIEGGFFEFKDEISAYEIMTDKRSHKIEEDYWVKRRLQNGNVQYTYCKIIALEKTVVDQKKNQLKH
jgi:hypothetical protein